MSQLRSSNHTEKWMLGNKLSDILHLNLSENSAFSPHRVLLFYQLEPLKSTSSHVSTKLISLGHDEDKHRRCHCWGGEGGG